jgi:hypothetical protein
MSTTERDHLEKLLIEQSQYTEALRRAANEAISYLSHIGNNYAKGVPDDLLRNATNRKVAFDMISIQPSPIESWPKKLTTW